MNGKQISKRSAATWFPKTKQPPKRDLVEGKNGLLVCDLKPSPNFHNL